MDLSLASIMEILVHWVSLMGYPGIFVFALIGATFLPIPEELTIIPAGYLAYQGELSLPMLLLICLGGSLCGSALNYWLARHYGRRLFVRFGRLVMMTPDKLARMENYFVEHGAISVFTGRLLPGAKHYIAFPAGLARMQLQPFFLYAALAAGLWIAILLGLGYEIGNNEAMIATYLKRVKVWVVLFAILIVSLYAIRHRLRRNA